MTATVDVIQDHERAHALLDATRLELLEHLAEPSSAAALARRLGLPRQRVNYHLRELEARQLVDLVEERRKGNATERIYRRAGDRFAISVSALGNLGSNPDDVADRFSSAYQIALASRTIAELGALQVGAQAAGKKLPTLSIDTEVRFADAAQRSEFAEELASCVAELVRRFHDDSAPEGRTFRVCVGSYQRPD